MNGVNFHDEMVKNMMNTTKGNRIMTREELTGIICPSFMTPNCGKQVDCNYCNKKTNKWLDEYEKQIRAEVVEEFYKTKIDVLNWLIKRQSEGYGTTNGELLDYIYDYKLKEQKGE